MITKIKLNNELSLAGVNSCQLLLISLYCWHTFNLIRKSNLNLDLNWSNFETTDETAVTNLKTWIYNTKVDIQLYAKNLLMGQV